MKGHHVLLLRRSTVQLHYLFEYGSFDDCLMVLGTLEHAKLYP